MAEGVKREMLQLVFLLRVNASKWHVIRTDGHSLRSLQTGSPGRWTGKQRAACRILMTAWTPAGGKGRRQGGAQGEAGLQNGSVKAWESTRELWAWVLGPHRPPLRRERGLRRVFRPLPVREDALQS